MKKITSLHNLFKLCLVSAMMLCGKNASAQTPIYSEDFGSITVGDNTTLTGSDTPWTANSNFATAWRTFQAGGALRLGNGNDSANLGYVITPYMDLSVNGGMFTLSFDVKGWTTVENQVKVIVTGQEMQFITYTATIDQDWERVTLNFTSGQDNSRIIIETTEKRAFIDNISITPTSSEQILSPTVTTAPSDITSTSFKANWGGVAGATGYILDVSTSLEFDTFIEGYQNLAVDGVSQAVEGLTPNTQYFYRVRATNATATSITSNVMGAVTAVLGLDSFNKIGLKYYPNPTNGVVNLVAQQNLSSVSVYNVMGQNVLNKQLNTANAQIDMAGLNAGHYFVKITSGNETATLKVVKQ